MKTIVFRPESHEYLIDGAKYPSVTQILQAQGIIDYSGVPADKLEAARLFGTAVHRTCELFDVNDLDETTLDPALRPYLDGWAKFLKESGFVIEGIERPVYSDLWRVAGTPDRIGALKGRSTVLDIKSSFELNDGTAIQLAGYELMENEHRSAKDKIKQRIAVLLKPDGDYILKRYAEETDTAVFCGAANNYHWRLRHGLIREA